jgi:hypothetical protein
MAMTAFNGNRCEKHPTSKTKARLFRVLIHSRLSPQTRWTSFAGHQKQAARSIAPAAMVFPDSSWFKLSVQPSQW